MAESPSVPLSKGLVAVGDFVEPLAAQRHSGQSVAQFPVQREVALDTRKTVDEAVVVVENRERLVKVKRIDIIVGAERFHARDK